MRTGRVACMEVVVRPRGAVVGVLPASFSPLHLVSPLVSLAYEKPLDAVSAAHTMPAMQGAAAVGPPMPQRLLHPSASLAP